MIAWSDPLGVSRRAPRADGSGSEQAEYGSWWSIRKSSPTSALVARAIGFKAVRVDGLRLYRPQEGLASLAPLGPSPRRPRGSPAVAAVRFVAPSFVPKATLAAAQREG